MSWRHFCTHMRRPLFKGVQKYPTKQKHLHSSVSPKSQRKEFDLWVVLISALTQGGLSPELGLHEACQLFNSGVKPNSYALVHLLRASKKQASGSYGQQLHCYILKSGFSSDVSVSTALISFYVTAGSLSDAHKLFDEIRQPSVVACNSLISGYVHSGQFRKALGLFVQLEALGIWADAYSFTAALSACGHLCLLHLGGSIHAKIIKFGLESRLVIANCLIDMYGKCGSAEEAVFVFNNMNEKDVISWNSVIAASARNERLEQAFTFLHQMPNPDTISYNEVISGIAQFGDIDDAIRALENMPNPNSSSWNSIITGYVNRNRAWEALEFVANMHSEDVVMDHFTYSSILSGIARVAEITWGMLIHCCTMKYGLDTSVVVGTALIDMYCKCGQVRSAELMFQSLPNKNLITWNAMISGYAHNGDFAKLIHLLEQLKMAGQLKPDGITCLNVFSACSHTQTSWDSAIEYFESMMKDEDTETVVEHCCSVIRLMGQRGEVEKAKKMIFKMGFGSYGAAWRTLLGASAACRNLKVAEIAAAKVVELDGDDDYVVVMLSNVYASYGKWENVRAVRELMRVKGVRKEAGYSWM